MAFRYWVGGNGIWDATNTTNWSTTSGGTGGASVPGSFDDVRVDTESGPTATYVTISGTRACKSFIYTGFMGFVPDTGSGFETGTLDVNGGTFRVNVLPYPSVNPGGGGFDYYLQWLNVIIDGATNELFVSVTELRDITFENDGIYRVASNISAQNISVEARSTVDLLGYTASCAAFVASSADAITNGTTSITPIATGFVAGFSSCPDTTGLTVILNDSIFTPEIGLNAPSTNAQKLNLELKTTSTTCTSSDVCSIKNLTFTGSGVNLYLSADMLVVGDMLTSSVNVTGNNSYLAVASDAPFTSTARTVQLGTGSSIYRMSFGAGLNEVNLSGSASFNRFDVTSKANLGSSLITIFEQFQISTLAQIDAGTSTINFEPQPAFSNIATLTTNEVSVFNIVEIYSPGTLRITSTSGTGNNTFSTLSCQGSGVTLAIKDGTTQTVESNFLLSGTSESERVTLTNISGGSPAIISKASGTVSASNANISYSTATGGAEFLALISDGNIEGASVTGWIFRSSNAGLFIFF